MIYSIMSEYVTLSRTIIGQSLYTFSSLIMSPMGVLTRKGSCKITGSKSNLLATKGVTKEKVDPGSDNAYRGKGKTCKLPVTTSADFSYFSLPFNA